jgi:hypothetical protein
MSDSTAAVSCAAPTTEESKLEAGSNLTNMTLPQIAVAIKDELNKLDRKQIGLYLIEGKKRLPHGGFMPWVSEYFPEISHKTATTWMKLAGDTEETNSSKRKAASPADRAKKLAAALQTLEKISQAEAKSLNPARLQRFANKIAPLVPSQPEPVKGSGGGALVAIAQQVVNWAKISGAPRGIGLSPADGALIKQACEILTACVPSEEAAAA